MRTLLSAGTLHFGTAQHEICRTPMETQSARQTGQTFFPFVEKSYWPPLALFFCRRWLEAVHQACARISLNRHDDEIEALRQRAKKLSDAASRLLFEQQRTNDELKRSAEREAEARKLFQLQGVGFNPRWMRINFPVA